MNDAQKLDAILASAEATIEGQATVLIVMALSLFFTKRPLTAEEAQMLVGNSTLCAAAIVANRKTS